VNLGRYRHRIDIYGSTKTTNEIGETEYIDGKVARIWAYIIPQTGSIQKQEVETILSNVTHKIIVRYQAGKSITQDMHIMFRGKRFDIKYILNPHFTNQTLEIFCQEVIE
jgi:SPP1 family predicted phage head-tail adaptor